MDWTTVAVSVVASLVLGRVVPRSVGASEARLARLEEKISALEARLRRLGGLVSSLGGGQETGRAGAGNEQVVSLVLEGKKINAIKLYREQTGIGLREAKDAVEQMERDLKRSL